MILITNNNNNKKCMMICLEMNKLMNNKMDGMLDVAVKIRRHNVGCNLDRFR